MNNRFNWQKIKKILFLSLSAAVLIASTFMGVRLVQIRQEIREKAAGSGVTLTMNPPNASINVNETVILALLINTGGDTVSAVDLHINYDHQILEAQSITAADFLPTVLKEGSTGPTIPATIILGAQPTQPKKGNGRLANIPFKALKAGTTTVAYLDNTQVAAIGQNTNAIDNKSGSQITVIGTSPTDSPASSPSASPAGSASPVPFQSASPISSPTVHPTAQTEASWPIIITSVFILASLVLIM